MTGIVDSPICYAANAVAGIGGQGEFLRHMVHALDQLPSGRILSRGAKSEKSECIAIRYDGWRRLFSKAIEGVPILRRRRDLITLLGETAFDASLAPHIRDVKLFNGVMGQCEKAFTELSARKVPLVLTALNMHIDTISRAVDEEHRRLGIQTPSFIHPLMRRRAHREIERATRIRVVSDSAKQSFVEHGVDPGTIETIPPAIDLDHFQPVAQKDDIFRVLAVMTIDPRKGAYYLLQAFEKAAIPGSELVIIGSTGDRWSHQMLHRFLGRMSNVRLQSANVITEPIQNTYGQASVFVHPAVEDGFALSVGQALACGKPVISTRQTGASQLIQDGVNGYVLECRDVDGLVDHLRTLALNPELVRKMSAAAPQAVAGLSFPLVAKQVAALYNRALHS